MKLNPVASGKRNASIVGRANYRAKRTESRVRSTCYMHVCWVLLATKASVSFSGH